MSEVLVTVDLEVKPDALEAMCAALPELIKDTAKRPGFIEIRIVQMPGTTKVLFVERWSSEQDYKNYYAWRKERGDVDNIDAALTHPWKINIWPVVIAAA